MNRQANMIAFEDEALCQACVSVSLDFINDANQPAVNFYSSSCNLYNNGENIQIKRSVSSLQSRFHVISTAVQFYVAKLSHAVNTQGSGTNEMDLVNQAREAYYMEKKKSFTFDRCYEILKDLPKFDYTTTTCKMKGDQAAACTFFVSNKCPFPIWPATAPNKGHPVIANGGFYLPPGNLHKFPVPSDWSGRIWARTGCNFASNWKPVCETGDCDSKLECNGSIGLPPVTLVQISLQSDKSKPSFYDVSLVDGYNLPVSVSTKPYIPKCTINGCSKNLNNICPEELQVSNDKGEVVACKSACLAFNLDKFCCRNEYGSPSKCKPSLYSKTFKDACPDYYSYAFDSPPPLVNCASDNYVITFCPSKWGSKDVPSIDDE